eukprot:3208537-Alexandrium_andersonii.AAC.1
MTRAGRTCSTRSFLSLTGPSTRALRDHLDAARESASDDRALGGISLATIAEVLMEAVAPWCAFVLAVISKA